MTIESPRIRAVRERAAQRSRHRARIVRPLIVAVYLIDVLPALGGHPRPGLHGAGIPVLGALIVSAVAVAGLLAAPASDPAAHVGGALGARRSVAVMLVLIAAGNLIDALQGTGGAAIGLTLVVWLAAANLETARAAALAIVAIVPLLVVTLLDVHPPALPILLSIVISSLMFLIARAGRLARDELGRSELLAAELADLHDAAADTAALAERGRIAREMHDVLAHSLSGLVIQLEAAALMGRREQISPALQGTLGRARRLAHEGLDEARRAIDALRGERVPGPDALPRLIEDFGRDAAIDVSLTIDGERRPLPAEAALTVYRVTQEALTNISRHSRAERATVRLCYEPEATRLVIADDGGGSLNGNGRLADVGAGYGITGMRERAALLDGTVSAADTDEGFRVDLVIPTGAPCACSWPTTRG